MPDFDNLEMERYENTSMRVKSNLCKAMENPLENGGQKRLCWFKSHLAFNIMIVRDCVGTLATEPAAAVMADLTAAVLCIGDLGVMHFRRGQHQPAGDCQQISLMSPSASFTIVNTYISTAGQRWWQSQVLVF